MSDELKPEKPKRKKRSTYRPVKHAHSLGAISRDFATEEECFEYLEKMRWPEGVQCLACESENVAKFTTNETTTLRKNPKTGKKEEKRVPSRQLYECRECKFQFSVKVGTLFNDSHLPLAQWFKAIAMMCEAKKGMSARQLQSHLQIGSYRTAWYLNHRIREAMHDDSPTPLSGTVEADETYIGGKYDKRRKRERWDKEPVFGIVQRDGEVRTWHIPQVNRWHVIDKLKEGISVETDLLCTDESQMYKRLPENVNRHEIVNHSQKEYVRGEVHTGTIDGYWGLLKRGLIGSYHRVSIKHLHRYLAEFQMRWNNRKNPDMFALVVIRLLIVSAMPYRKLVAPVPETPNSGPIVSLDEEPF